MGGIWETASFALRAVGQRNQQLQVISTLSTLLLLLSQLWINAFAYVTAGRLIHCFSPTHAALGIRAIKIGQIFVGCDIISFIVQIIGGLLRWEVLVWALYAVLALITIRITYRLVEFAGGFEPTNKVLYNENYLLFLDGVADAAGRTGADTHTSWGCVAGTRFFISKEAALVEPGSETRVQACYKGAGGLGKGSRIAFQRAVELPATRLRAGDQGKISGYVTFRSLRTLRAYCTLRIHHQHLASSPNRREAFVKV
ncbi:hypothetical protein GTA08_BOTSDO07373 [Botryosphaeria dothidea]|uniref:Uncharacterized protein n=1 Tax=Botryosphaeria dothidea TaxID=55169 RepID=A0A8H4IMV9_9PEZI|nr:hypothetical protein GTA08_BOTSDO07373 [Botryosphaeria dothidea]